MCVIERERVREREGERENELNDYMTGKDVCGSGMRAATLTSSHSGVGELAFVVCASMVNVI